MAEQLNISFVERQRCATELCSAWKKWIGESPLEHSPYSPDFVPCDFWAFSTIKGELRGKKFRSDQEVKTACSTILLKLEENGLQHVSEKWMERCKKCIACHGRYFEK
jgi:hypothetical protein